MAYQYIGKNKNPDRAPKWKENDKVLVYCKQWCTCDCKVAFLITFMPLLRYSHEVQVFAAKHSDKEDEKMNCRKTRVSKSQMIQIDCLETSGEYTIDHLYTPTQGMKILNEEKGEDDVKYTRQDIYRYHNETKEGKTRKMAEKQRELKKQNSKECYWKGQLMMLLEQFENVITDRKNTIGKGSVGDRQEDIKPQMESLIKDNQNLLSRVTSIEKELKDIKDLMEKLREGCLYDSTPFTRRRDYSPSPSRGRRRRRKFRRRRRERINFCWQNTSSAPLREGHLLLKEKALICICFPLLL